MHGVFNHLVSPSLQVANDRSIRHSYIAVINSTLQALCCIAAGRFGYPIGDAVDVALTTTRNWLEKHHNQVYTGPPVGRFT